MELHPHRARISHIHLRFVVNLVAYGECLRLCCIYNQKMNNMKKFLCVISIALITLCSCEKGNEPTPSVTPTPTTPTVPKTAYDEIGALSGKFSVSSSKKIRFSRGLLQYNPISSTWMFAETQSYTCGQESEYKTVTFDRFGWATSGYDGYLPTMNGTNYYTYYQGMNDISGTPYDWGNNAIKNGGNKTGIWFTLTIKEWEYLLEIRPNAYEKLGFGNVDGHSGLILLPDNWTAPDNCPFKPFCKYNETSKRFEFANDVPYYEYSKSDWEKMEMNGAVFIFTFWSTRGTWSSTPGNDRSVAYLIRFDERSPKPTYIRDAGRQTNCYVRLVTDR